MTPSEIKKEIDRLTQKMLDKDYVHPTICVSLNWLNEGLSAHINYKADNYSYAKDDFLYADFDDGFAGILAKVEAKIDALPSITEAKRNEFIAAVGRLIDQGRGIGVDVEFLNPLTDMMKKLSENVITHQSVVTEYTTPEMPF